MEIANPIYDVVFKYMMEDLESARIFLSALLEVDVIEVNFSTQEGTKSLEKSPKPRTVSKKKTQPDFGLGLFRMDFVAKIKTKEQEVFTVVIELQKVKLLTDIARFREYLASQYSSQSNYYDSTDRKGVSVKNALPIYSVYILGERLDNIQGIPLIGVERRYINLSTREVIQVKDPFIECLTHDCRIVIVSDLPGHQSTEIEKMLMIFDQTKRKDSGQVLDFNKAIYPQKYAQLLRRLEKAAHTNDVRALMDKEDLWLQEYRYWDMNTERYKKEAENERKRAEDEREKAAVELKQKLTLVKILLEKGMNTEEVAAMVGLSVAELTRQLEGE